MDACRERISNLLCQGGQSTARTLARLVEKAGLARSTIMIHLKHLEDQDLIAKEEILQGSVGRPKILYKPTKKLLEQLVQTKSD